MNTFIFVPVSRKCAGRELRHAVRCDMRDLPTPAFMRAWCAIAYLFPGLHPDDFDADESGWPRVLKRFGAEAWRRFDAGELDAEELYPSDAQWAGIFDRMPERGEEAIARRLELTSAYGIE